MELEILDFWKTIDAFQTSLKMSEGRPEYSFYDGPPFATGLPHYGHILAGTIKDTVTRYAHQSGFHVTRRFGWDCHGLPIEFEIDKQFNVRTRDQVLALGLDKYNEACRSIVLRYSSEWEAVVTRLGRWIDFRNDYKTMDVNYMESVWWVFRTLWDKGLLYRGFKVMPYSKACNTPLSNFEANMAYKDVEDPDVVIKFALRDRDNAFLLAWTTTPWTLPSNLALVVHPDEEYVTVLDRDTSAQLTFMRARLDFVYPPKKKPDATPPYTVLTTAPGRSLAGLRYTPLFPFFATHPELSPTAFSVLCDTYVTSDSGTGIVHSAPAFGEDDYRVCLANHVVAKGGFLPLPLDANGRFTDEVPPFVGQDVKDADAGIVQALKTAGRVWRAGKCRHSYPFCWRSDQPLIYRAVPSWFVNVEAVKERLLRANAGTHWVPEAVKDKRFHNWLEGARDWAVSRNRYWGTPLPIWVNEQDPSEMVCIGSRAELERLTGYTGDDLHRHKIDHLTIPSPSGRGVLRRVEETADCWFESGAMPYAQLHYPFENEELFRASFPADFIAEGLDQTRGWFYTLQVLSTALFDAPAFRNVIVNGLVLAEDGKKMSKRLRNYPDPTEVIVKFGADALRLYLINSPVVRAEELRFREDGVRSVLKDVLLPWFNAVRFFCTAATLYRPPGAGAYAPRRAGACDNVMDRWVLAACHGLLLFVREEMKAYRLYTVVPRLLAFFEQLTNWFIRLNRPRLKGVRGEAEQAAALDALFEVLVTLARAMAPFAPFFAEFVYQQLLPLLPEGEGKERSVHFTMFPQPREELIDEGRVRAVQWMQDAIEMGRQCRDRRTTPVKIPLCSVIVVAPRPEVREAIELLAPYVALELNVETVTVTEREGDYVALQPQLDKKRLGKRLGRRLAAVEAHAATLPASTWQTLQQTGSVTFTLPAGDNSEKNEKNVGDKKGKKNQREVTEEEGGEVVLEKDDVTLVRTFCGDAKRFEAGWTNDMLIVLDVLVTDDMRARGMLRQVVNRVQKLRKAAGLNVNDEVGMAFATVDGKKGDGVVGLLRERGEEVQKVVGGAVVPWDGKGEVIAQAECEIGDEFILLVLLKKK